MATETLSGLKSALVNYIVFFVDLVKREDGLDLKVDKDKAAENIEILFDRYINELVLPTESGHVQLDKIVAMLEISVRRVEPITVPGKDVATNITYNSRLATQVAISFWLEAEGIDLKKFGRLIKEDVELRNFLSEHHTWLTRLKIRYFSSVFTLAQVWRLFHLVVADRIVNV